jgi:hypothetical protein
LVWVGDILEVNLIPLIDLWQYTCMYTANKFINFLAIPSSLSRLYSTFPLYSWTTLIEIAVCSIRWSLYLRWFYWTSKPKVAGLIPTVVKESFQLARCGHTRSNIISKTYIQGTLYIIEV